MLVAPTSANTGDLTFASTSLDIVEAELESIAALWARNSGQRIHARAGTARASGGEIARLGRRGLLEPHVTLSHCIRLSDADFDAIAASSTAVALTPASDMAGGSDHFRYSS